MKDSESIMFGLNFKTIPIISIAIAVLIRWQVAQFNYSGFNTPPLFGDYEAQRHWMEITTNLPVDQWYKNSTDNDLSYWGLDYPPLTAYHMFALGKISEQINSSWVKLHESRGTESQEHKIFMRYSVLTADFVFYMISIVYYFHNTEPSHYKSPPANSQKQNIAIYTALVLLYPAQILVDHGHYQYNCVFMGLVLLAIILMSKNQQVLAAIFYTLSIGYKQMSLYYSLPFFWYIASTSLRRGSIIKCVGRLILFAFVVSATTTLIFLPFLRDVSDVLQVLHRMFPVSRGLFEDKVGNLWFCLNIPFKLKTNYPIEHLLKLSAVSTLIMTLPAGLHLMFRPSIRAFKYALVNSSMIFFLLSFQVHEKTILLPALPILLLFREHPIAVNWFAIISTFSLQPLLIKDDLLVPYQILMIMYTLISFEIFGRQISFNWNKLVSSTNLLTVTYICSVLGCFILNGISIFVTPPPRYPDIHPTVNAIYTCAHLVLFLLFFYHQQFTGQSKTSVAIDKATMSKKIQ